MSLVTRQGKGSKLTIQEMDGNLEYLEQLAQSGGGTIPVLTEYPTTDSTKAGSRFWYKGNEWHYMTQDEIDSTGWTGIVNVGFPAPVTKGYNTIVLGTYTISLGLSSSPNNTASNTVIDFLGFGNPQLSLHASFGYNPNIIGFRNANFLINLEDKGTIVGFFMSSLGLSDVALNDLFTQLPLTTKTVTINATGNPGSATCDPTIATAKGYTVIT